MDTVTQLQSMGLSLPSPAYIFGAIVFSVLGMVAWVMGKRKQKATTKWLGVALMFYSYAVSSTVMLYVVGIALCVAIVWDERSQS
jgi:hypothetical protein